MGILQKTSPIKNTLKKFLGFTDIIARWKITPYYDPIVFYFLSYPNTAFGDSDFLLLEEADSFLGLADDPDCPAYNPFYYDPEGDILILEAILNSEPPLPPPSQGTYLPEVRTELKVCETNTANSSVDEHLLRLNSMNCLPQSRVWHFGGRPTSCPVIIAKIEMLRKKSALKRYTYGSSNLIAPNWTTVHLELCCDQRFRIGAVLWHVMRKHFRPTTMLDAKARLLRWFSSSKNLTSKVMIQRRERFAADHLSRLENPYENVNDPKEINESFPLETLNMVTFRGDSRTPWFADFANYHAEDQAMVSRNEALEILLTCPQLDPPGIWSYSPSLHRVITHNNGQVEVANRGLQRILESTIGSGYHQKDRKPSQNDKTEHGMEKTVQNQGQSPKMPKSESILMNPQSNGAGTEEYYWMQS
ncbi:hypothetical protein Tco_0051805 [Tanacetum coccineum]